MSKIKLLRFINTALTILFKLTLLIFSSSASAQTATEFNSWWYYVGTYKVLDRVSVQTMYSWNRNDFVKNWQQSKLKIGGGYDLSNHWKVYGGYEWVILYPYGKYPILEKRAENRIYEELKYDGTISALQLSTSVRAEQRFLNNNVSHRVRLQTGVRFPIWKLKNKTLLGFSFYDQVIFNTDKKLANQYLAQNRLYGGTDIFLKKSFTLSVGYLNQRIFLSRNRIENNNTLIISLSQYLDLTKRKNAQLIK